MDTYISPDHEEFYVKLDKYTLSAAVDQCGRRWWTPFDGPIVQVPAQGDTCLITVDDETRTVTRVEAERILVECGSIVPALDDPAHPVYSWTA